MNCNFQRRARQQNSVSCKKKRPCNCVGGVMVYLKEKTRFSAVPFAVTFGVGL